ncbi:MAG: hypothetical protein ACE5GG_02845, partial [Candidatus Omnitrophota bacterium]
MNTLRPLAMGIGSLPHLEAAPAVDFVLSCFKDDILFWPQLPKRDFFEQMTLQFSRGIPGLAVDKDKKRVWVDTKSEGFSASLEVCFQHYLDDDRDYFAIGPDYAAGWYELLARLDSGEAREIKGIKGQVVGPITLGMSLRTEEGQPIIYHPELRDALVKTLAMRARWQAVVLKRATSHEPRATIIISIDEPYLASWGSSFWALSKEDVVAGLNEVAAGIHKEGALCAVHCCANTDWPVLLSADLDILSFDAYGYLDNLLLYPDALAGFLRRGGILAMGVVPNSPQAEEKNRD